MRRPRGPRRFAPSGFAILALLVGAVTTAFAPILVRLSELGPTPTAFYRFLLAAPLYWVLALPVPGGGRRLRR